MKQFLRNNGLSVVFFVFFLIALTGQAFTGWKHYNSELEEQGGHTLTLSAYLTSAHFVEATFENWESEFLQMALYVTLTMFLYQKGSSESKDPDDPKEEVDREPDPNKKEAPWPVRAGGWVLGLYKNSLSYTLYALFLLSFIAHWLGSVKEYNIGQTLNGKPTETAFEYLGNSKLWFESFENWQSEFLSVFAIVLLSVYLRQKGSPQSKPVDAPNAETGE